MIFQFAAVAELGIKSLLEYLQVWATTLVSLFFIYVIPIDCKIINFSLYLLSLEYTVVSCGTPKFSMPHNHLVPSVVLRDNELLTEVPMDIDT